MQPNQPIEENFPVVVVDDDATTGEVICAILEGEGYPTTYFMDGATALSAVQAARPALVTLDWRLRGAMTGEELFRALRQSADTASIPILICTAEAHLLERQPTLRGRATEVVTKPFDLDDLLTVVSRLAQAQNF
ncbi:MAG TPA: response regulator [Chloroflexota bacterium]|jgi:CheY-like chemotaxis protein|nr:response regulator [Chloroflexota bacterium]